VHTVCVLCTQVVIVVYAHRFFSSASSSLSFYDFFSSSLAYFQVDSLRRTLSTCSNKKREKRKRKEKINVENTPSLCNLHLNKNENESDEKEREREREEKRGLSKLISSVVSYANSGALLVFSLIFFSSFYAKFNHRTIDFVLIFMNYSIHHSRNSSISRRRKEKKNGRQTKKSDWCKIRLTKRTNKM